MLEDLLNIPVIGVIPWMDIDMEDEDSVTERFSRRSGAGQIKTAIVRLPHISNFTDFNLLGSEADVAVNYITRPSEVKDADSRISHGRRD